jgi:hypothetical protein
MAIGNIEKINKIISEKYNLPLDVIEKINERYWNDIRDKLISLEDNSIAIKNIGAFTIGTVRLKKSIFSLIKNIRTLQKRLKKGEIIYDTRKLSLDKSTTIEQVISIRKEYLKQLLVCRNKLAIYTKEKFEHRKQNYIKQYGKEE